MSRRYHILDVFTDRPLAGNPLAVVLDSDGLDGAAMQAIAREFNLSETVFVGAPRDPVNSAAVRIFTPTTELPFAGHPTVGTAILVAELRARELLATADVGLVLEAPIGLVTCSVRHRRGEAAHARFEVPRLAERDGAPPTTPDLADRLGLAETEIGFAAHAPIRLSAGVPFTFVPVSSLEALARARLRVREAAAPDAYYLYTPVAGETRSFRSRMLASGLGVAEDPATGAAAAAFPGAILAAEAPPDGEADCFLVQGVEMGRPSRIGIAWRIEQGRLAATTIGGSAVMVAEGTLAL